jgi:acyl-CoA thioester hydrolase
MAMSEPVAFHWPVRVYWEDTDAGGVVYHANYVKFFERARTEWLRAAGIEQDRLRADQGIMFAVRSMTLDFVKPAKLDDLLGVSVIVRELRSASFIIDQQIIRKADDVLLASAQARCACLAAATFKPCVIPQNLIKEIQPA